MSEPSNDNSSDATDIVSDIRKHVTDAMMSTVDAAIVNSTPHVTANPNNMMAHSATSANTSAPPSAGQLAISPSGTTPFTLNR